jgi:hypothetical protein
MKKGEPVITYFTHNGKKYFRITCSCDNFYSVINTLDKLNKEVARLEKNHDCMFNQ